MTDRFQFDTHVAIAQCADITYSCGCNDCVADGIAQASDQKVRFKRADVHSHGDRLHGAV